MKGRPVISILLAGILSAAPASAQQPAGRFNRFWRNAFATKEGYPTLRVIQSQERRTYLSFMQALSLSGGLVGTMYVTSQILGPMADDFNSLVRTLQMALLVPDAPFDLQLTAEGGRVVVKYRFNGIARALYVFNLYHFDGPNAVPRRVASVANINPAAMDVDPFELADHHPPQSGTTFYAVTAIRIRGSDSGEALSTAEVKQLAPWWSYPIGGRSDDYVTWWSDQGYGFMSDFSEPVAYNAEPWPPTGGVDALAIDPEGETVYVSRPGEARIARRDVSSRVAGVELPFANTRFPAPGQKGLAMGPRGELYADNGASDAAYGGRIFRFDPDGTRTFVGSINYFSQFMMYAKPAEAGPMTMTPEGQLLVADFIEREWKLVPVRADYDPYRRIGKRFVRLDDYNMGQALDVEIGLHRVVYMLDREALVGVRLDRPVPMGRIPLPRQE